MEYGWLSPAAAVDLASVGLGDVAAIFQQVSPKSFGAGTLNVIKLRSKNSRTTNASEDINTHCHPVGNLFATSAKDIFSGQAVLKLGDKEYGWLSPAAAVDLASVGLGDVAAIVPQVSPKSFGAGTLNVIKLRSKNSRTTNASEDINTHCHPVGNLFATSAKDIFSGQAVLKLGDIEYGWLSPAAAVDLASVGLGAVAAIFQQVSPKSFGASYPE